MNDQLSVREKVCLLFSIGPWGLVLGQATAWVIDPGRFHWGMLFVWCALLLIALFFTSAALPRVPR